MFNCWRIKSETICCFTGLEVRRRSLDVSHTKRLSVTSGYPSYSDHRFRHCTQSPRYKGCLTWFCRRKAQWKSPHMCLTTAQNYWITCAPNPPKSHQKNGLLMSLRYRCWTNWSRLDIAWSPCHQEHLTHLRPMSGPYISRDNPFPERRSLTL